MENAKRDDNHVHTMIAVQADGTVTLGKIDHVTGRLLVALQPATSFPVPATQAVVRDDNHVPAIAGATAAGDAKGILIDNTNDGIIATVTIE